MVQHQNVRFRQHKIGHDGEPIGGENHPVGGTEPANLEGIEVCEIKLDSGDVLVVPAHDMVPDRKVTYAQLYGGRYQAFKNGEPAPLSDAERIEYLEGQVRDRDELLAKHGIKRNEETGARKNVEQGLNPDDPSSKDKRFESDGSRATDNALNREPVATSDTGKLVGAQGNEHNAPGADGEPVTDVGDDRDTYLGGKVLSGQKTTDQVSTSDDPDPAFNPGAPAKSAGYPHETHEDKAAKDPAL